MTDLFMKREAIISPCGLYRYWLTRVWDQGKARLVVCMLNPSTADATKDDPTLLTLIHFAKLWGYGGLIVINLFAYRTPSPTALVEALNDGVDIVGPDNWVHIDNALGYARNLQNPVLVGWGNGGELNRRDARFWTWATNRFHTELVCLGTTLSGHPKHPMARGQHRISRNQQPIPWRLYERGIQQPVCA